MATDAEIGREAVERYVVIDADGENDTNAAGYVDLVQYIREAIRGDIEREVRESQKIVWAVESGERPEHYFHGIFATENLAERFARKHYHGYVSEWEIVSDDPETT